MRQNVRGDTIVEVMLAIAISSLIITSGLASASHSFNGTQLAQQRGEALKLAEAQVEILKSLTNKTDVNVVNESLGHTYCLLDTGEFKKFASNSLPELQDDDFSGYHSECKDKSVHYNLSIQYDNTDDSYTVRARWDGATQTKQEVSLRYRAFQRSIASTFSAPTPPSPPGPGPSPPSPLPPPSGPNCVSPQLPIVISGASVGGALGPSHLYAPRQLTYSMDISAQTASFTTPCSAIISIETTDPGHPGGPRQDNERLYARIYLEGPGNQFIDTGLTDDLPAETVNITTTVGTFNFPRRPVRVEFRHYSLHPLGTGDRRPNSIEPHRLILTPVTP